MPQLNTLIITDEADPQVQHTFTPNGIQGGVASLEVNSGVPIANTRLTASQVTTSNGKRKTTLKLAVPVVQDSVVNGIARPTIVRTAYVDVTFTADATSSTFERGHIRNMVRAILGSGDVQKLVDDLSPMY